MIDMNLQFFGGNGSSGGPSLGGGGGSKVNIQDELDVWSYRHDANNAPFVDEINAGVRAVQEDFPGVMDSVGVVNAATLGGDDKTQTLGYYGQGKVGINDNYTNVSKMNDVYDRAVAEGHHPSRGNLSGTEAVAIHEMGHALTDHLAGKMGVRDLDAASKKIVNAAYKSSKGKGGTKAWAGKISGYAQESFAECVAEAVADYYCNGSKASSASKAIFAELKRVYNN